MTLPTVQLPTYEVKLPSTGEMITVRPFIVKEEKLLLMVAGSDDENEIVNTTKQVIRNCIIDGSVNVDKLPFFDVDYLFTVLRAKSVGEKIETTFTCNNVSDEGEYCGHTFFVDIDLGKAEVRNLDIDKTIKLSDKMSVKMRYPTYSAIRKIGDDTNVLDTKIQIIADSIDIIVDGDNVYSRKDYTSEDLVKFVEELTRDKFTKLEEFIDNFPSFFIGIDYKCGKCGFDHHLEYDDFTDFFQ